MNSEITSNSQDKSFIPIVLVSASIIFFFGWQLITISTARGNINTQKKQVDAFAEANLQKYSDAVKKAEQIEGTLSKLANGVYELSKTDDNAKQVVDNLKKLGIQYQSAQNSASPAPSGQP